MCDGAARDATSVVCRSKTELFSDAGGRGGALIRAVNGPQATPAQATEALFNVIHQSSEFSVSKTTLGSEYATLIARHTRCYGGATDAPGMVLIRCVFMNPYWAARDFREALFPQFIALLRHALAQGARLGPPTEAANIV